MMQDRGLFQEFSELTDPELGTVFILNPAVEVDALAEALAPLGFTRTPLEGADPSAHVAVFSLRGAAPHVIYSHNPVVDLRVLEVGTVPPRLRAEIARCVPKLTRVEIEQAIFDPDDRVALRAIWAALETERLDMIEPLEAVARSARGIVSEEAARVRGRLGEVNEARENVIGGARLVAVAAVELTEALTRLPTAQALLAGPDEAAVLFVDEVAERVADKLRDTPIALGRGYVEAAASDEDVVAAPAGLLRWHNMLSRRFPQGYRDCAGWLRPDKIWLSWQVQSPRHGRIHYDGLVFTGDRWILCPRPFRLLEAALGAPHGG